MAIPNRYLPTSEIINDSFTGEINGSNKVFTLSVNYAAGKIKLYWNGMRQKSGTDYTETTVNQITTTFTPLTGDIIIIDFIPA